MTLDTRVPVPRRRRWLAVGVALATIALAPPAEAGRRHTEGEKVEVTGLVTDAQGRPLPGVRVVLEASRSHFSLRHFQRVEKDATRLTTLTDDKGTYTLTWPWRSYYNTFVLLVGVQIRKPDGERFHELERVDLSRRLGEESPTVATVVVKDAELVTALRKFLASIQSADERRIYQEQGKPDRVEEGTGPGVREAAWWYFESGKVYRFRNGDLVATETFDPVKGF